jgi:hypothetical protein
MTRSTSRSATHAQEPGTPAYRPLRKGPRGPVPYIAVWSGEEARRAMRHLLCQVCAGPADHNEQGALWLLRDHRKDWSNWPEDMGNGHPPLCLRCARISVRVCPWLRPGYVAVRAHSAIVGVSGALYTADSPFPRFAATTTVAYGDAACRWMRAGQLLRTLRYCAMVEL